MCIIIYKPKGIAMPDKERLSTAWEKNKDGGGFMYFSNSMVKGRKGFTCLKGMLASLSSLSPEEREGDIVMHFRIKTHGKINAECCHPFPLTDSYDEMSKSKWLSGVGVAHNGMLGIIPETQDVSDTMCFIKHCIMKHQEVISDKDVMFDMARGSNKFAFMVADGQRVILVGDFIEDGGVKYSNYGYKKPVYLSSINGCTSYSQGGFGGNCYGGYATCYNCDHHSCSIQAEPCKSCYTHTNKPNFTIQKDSSMFSDL